MNKIVCPHCHNTFEIDNQDYAAILNQVRDKEFEKTTTKKIKRYGNNLKND